jgi:hypothetical protein
LAGVTDGLNVFASNNVLFENVIYRNIDILDHKEMQIGYQGCLSINAGDNNLIRNITFENTRIKNMGAKRHFSHKY